MFKKYDNILVLSGAGFGIDSGLPDFEDMHRITDQAAQQFNIEPYIIERPDFYKKNPRIAWGINAYIMDIFLTKKPHSGYFKLKELLQDKNHFIVTSNIDDHFRDAGFDETKLYEIHGRLNILQCVNRTCNQKHNLWPLKEVPVQENMILKSKIPKCIYCGGDSRPNVCFTDDASYSKKLRDCQKAKYNTWIKHVANKRKPNLLILEIGCGRHIDSIGVNKLDDGSFRILSKELAFPTVFNESNIKVIRVNPDRNIPKHSWEEVHYKTGVNFFR